VVFNFPVNDTLINDEENYGSKKTYYQAVREMGRDQVWERYEDIIITRPVDKRENFIKRCVAIGGDELQIINGIVHINGKPQDVFPHSERYYLLHTPANGSYPDKDQLKEWGISIREDQGDLQQDIDGTNGMMINITNEEKAHLKLPAGYTLTDYIASVNSRMFPSKQLYPYYESNNNWTIDNFGPILVPKKGSTINLTPDNLIRYQRCIEVYEGNKVDTSNGLVLINGKPATTYTFRMDYYWMMGDNRGNSLDSRYWGFVPEDHIVGKASLIWFSWEGGPRWKRLFNSIK
jgi:signal peptidase I